MPEAAILLPTHDHASTLPLALESVRGQSVRDLDILVVGDGVGDDTREVVSEIAREDARVRFLDRPKGERNGERHRHDALAEARSPVVCYACDDDLWLPRHVETLLAALADSDFAHTLPLNVESEGRVEVTLFDAAHPGNQARMERHRIGFGLASAGHTLAAYRRLPHGWRPAPPDARSDLYMWRQFFDSGCRVRSVFRPTVVHFGSPFRLDWTPAQRADELARWLPRLQAPDAELRLAHMALDAAGARYGASTALRFELAQVQAEAEAARGTAVWRAPRALRTARRILKRFPG